MANRKSQKNNRNNQKRYANSSKRVSAHEGLKGKSPQGILDDQSARKWLIRGGVLITLVMWFSLNDPFNSPKSWFLSIIGFGLLGWLFFNFKKFIKDKTLRIATAITLIFGSTLTLAWILTDNKFIGFFGQYGRKTGLLEYICLLVFFLTASYLIRLKSIKLIEQAMVFLGLVLGIYGIFQHFQIDFVKWNYQYNSILGTLGNPDFAGAMMAILLVFNFGIVMNRTKWDRFRILSLINIPLLLIVILFSQVRQGLLAAAVGISLVTLVIIRQRNKNIAISLWGITIVAGIAVVAGLLKFGPLTKYFYKISVTYRGDYWRAAVRMFAHHPFFGVGLDRYGAYFRQYRDITQTLRRGPAVVADAAHNVPLQLAATGGVFVLLAFLVFTGFTIWRGIAALQKTTGQEQIIVAIFFGTWITYQAQSMISIDNLGIAIWGYLLGGCLVGLSISHQDFDSQPHGPKVGQILTSGLLGLIFVIISFLFFQSEGDVHTLAAIVPPKDPSLVNKYEVFVKKPLTHLFKEPTFELIAAQDYKSVGDTRKAIETYKQIIANDHRNVEALTQLANLYAVEKNWSESINLDKKLVELDPYNQSVLLQLGIHLESSGDTSSAKALISKITELNPTSPEAKQAVSELE